MSTMKQRIDRTPLRLTEPFFPIMYCIHVFYNSRSPNPKGVVKASATLVYQVMVEVMVES